MAAPEMPALYTAMDAVAIKVQQRYLRLLAGDLLCLLLAGVISSVEGPSEWRQIIHVATAALFAISLILSLVLAKKSYQRAWYRARAGAESVKTLAWRYVTGAPPYPLAMGHNEVDARLADDMRRILQEAGDVSLGVAADVATRAQITDSMRGLRGSGWEERKAAYLADRVDDQRLWYGRKAKWNEQRSNRWFTGMIVAQAVALLCAIIQAVHPSAPINAGAVLAAIAAVCMAWLQAKDFEELAQAYTVTAHELGLIAAQGAHVNADDALADFVASAEGAISREHTLWLAKRDRRVV